MALAWQASAEALDWVSTWSLVDFDALEVAALIKSKQLLGFERESRERDANADIGLGDYCGKVPDTFPSCFPRSLTLSRHCTEYRSDSYGSFGKKSIHNAHISERETLVAGSQG